jgi:hypothetical protein
MSPIKLQSNQFSEKQNNETKENESLESPMNTNGVNEGLMPTKLISLESQSLTKVTNYSKDEPEQPAGKTEF